MRWPLYPPMKEEAVKVLLLTENKLHYSCVLRGTLPLEHLKRKGLATYGHQHFAPDNPRLTEEIHAADVLVIFALSDARWHGFVTYAREKLGKAVVADFDDDLWDLCPGNFAYEHLGRQEVVARVVSKEKPEGELRMWWHDGRDGFWAQANRLLLARVGDMARNCTAVSVANRRLEGHLLAYNPEVEVLGNCVDLDIWHTNRTPYPGGRFRVGWQGGDSHRRDMMEVADQLARFVVDNDDVDLVVCGTFIEELRNAVPHERVEFHPWVNSEAYPYLMMTLGLDVGLAPLAGTRFNARKSTLKWLEYSAMAVPTIASAVAPYTDEVRDGEDGLLVGRDGWYDALSRARRSRLDLRAMGIRARRRMEAEYDIRNRCMDWYRFYRGISKGERAHRFFPVRGIGGLGGKNFKSHWFNIKRAM